MNDKRKQTIRQEIISHLENGPMTVREISQSVGILGKGIGNIVFLIVKRQCKLVWAQFDLRNK